MLRFGLAILMAPALFGQLATDVLSKAPPAVDEALRARIKEFYQLHVDGKFRLAEKLVAEDTKDFVYAAGAPRYLDYEIRSITYQDDFTKAKALVLCNTYINNPAFAGKPVPFPAISRWKVVDGNWFFYVDPEDAKSTPWGGKMQGGFPTAGQGGTAIPRMPTEEEALAKLSAVSADKQSVRLESARAFTDRVVVHNELPGTVSLKVSAPRVAGLEVLPDKNTLASGEKATVTFRYTPPEEAAAAVPPATAHITIEPTGRVLPVRIEIAK